MHQLLKRGCNPRLPELWNTMPRLCFLNHVKCFSLERYGGLSTLRAPMVISIKKGIKHSWYEMRNSTEGRRRQPVLILLGEIYFYMSSEQCLRADMWSRANCAVLKHFPWLWLWVIGPRLHCFCPLDEFHVAWRDKILLFVLNAGVLLVKRLPEDVVHWLSHVCSHFPQNLSSFLINSVAYSTCRAATACSWLLVTSAIFIHSWMKDLCKISFLIQTNHTLLPFFLQFSFICNSP